MAYQEKYYKEIHSQGHNWRLEFLQNADEAIIPTEIGPVLQALKLIVQGDQADIDTPIVKTSLEIVFVDATDLEDDRKCGYWEEFYTSSAIEYMVRLYKNGEVEWTGYVTPDSFSEDLTYRNSVSIIARDNLGYMQDFMCAIYTPSGQVSFIDLLNNALEKVSFGMEYVTSELLGYCQSGDDRCPLTEVLFNTSAFKDMTWYEVIESTMMALGLTFRYIGGNLFALASIRETSKCGRSTYIDMRKETARFLAGARRELSPSVKAIKDSVSYDILESVVQIDIPESQYGDRSELAFMETGDNATTYLMPVYAATPQGGAIPGMNADLSRLINPFAYKLKPGATDSKNGPIHTEDTLFALCNTVSLKINEDDDGNEISREYPFNRVNPVIIRTPIQVPGKVEVSFTFGWPVSLYDDMIGDLQTTSAVNDLTLLTAGFRGKWEGNDGVVLYLTQNVGENAWFDNDVSGIPSYTTPNNSLKNDVTITLPELDVASTGVLEIDFYGCLIDTSHSLGRGAYIRVKNITIRSAEEGKIQLASKSRITTDYNNNNNLLLQRSPSYCPNPGLPLAPQMVVNNIYTKSNNLYVGAYDWKWHDIDNEDVLPLSALIHKQMLCYYAKPNNVLTGELYVLDDMPDFATLYEWKGALHTLMSGQLNILTGRMENAVLREFIRYDHMWETWAENEDIVVDYEESEVTIYVHSNKDLDRESWLGFPIWITPIGDYPLDDGHAFVCKIQANTLRSARSTDLKIDTAIVRITQRAAGDYNVDYSEDYS